MWAVMWIENEFEKLSIFLGKFFEILCFQS